MAETRAKGARGPYAQGRKSRELILETALEVIGRKGYGSTMLQDISEAVGMTQAGLLHHFGSRDNLFAEVLRQRDAVNRRNFAGGDDDYPMTVLVSRHNSTVPGLIQLHVSMAAAAASPDHPLHDYLVERDRDIHASVMADIQERQARGRFDPAVDAAWFARVLLGLAEGLQAQWTINPSVDVAGTIERLWDAHALPADAGS